MINIISILYFLPLLALPLVVYSHPLRNTIEARGNRAGGKDKVNKT